MNYSIKSILAPIDFSEGAENALRLAVAIAERHQASIHLLNIVSAYAIAPALENASHADEQLALLVASAREHLDKYKDDIVRDNHLTVTVTAEFGTVYNNICNYVVVNDIDLVIMGAHGISGNYTQQIVNHAPIPVLTLKV